MLAEAGFWTLLAIVVYIYVGYPLGVLLLAPFRDRKVRKADIVPTVTVVVSAYNEEAEIGRTVGNLLEQDYPRDRFRVLVVSDGSTDRTDGIVSELAQRSGGRLLLLRQQPRQGKTQALNLARGAVHSEIVAFADANSIYAPNALRALVRSFADPTVGYVTGRMSYTNESGSPVAASCLAYMRYENLLRRLETRLGSIVGVDGGIDAIRHELFVRMRPEELPDFALPLSVVESGHRVVYECDAVLYEPALARASDELRMRVRVALRALWTLHDRRPLLNPFRGALYAWQLFSHKVMRYLACVPLAGLFANSIAVAPIHPLYFWFLMLECACFALAVAGHLARNATIFPAQLSAPYYFCIVNVACALALWKFCMRQRITVWKPRTGDEPSYPVPGT